MSKALWASLLLVVGCGSGAPGNTVAPMWSATLAAVSPSLLGHNTVWSRGGLGVWNDGASTIDPTVQSDVSALAPGVLRFPGGTRAMKYHFDGAIGPYAQRTPQCDAFTGSTDGTHYGLDEFLAFASAVGAQVSLVAPWVDGTPEEAAAMIAYANASTAINVSLGTDANGKSWGNAADWATRRAQNGHPAPYAVRWLEFGNEPYLSLPTGPPVSCGRMGQFVQSERYVNGQRIPTTAADYATQLAKAGALIRAVDPTVRIGAPAAATYDGSADAAQAIGDVDAAMHTGQAWNPTVLAMAHDAFDFFVLHPYDFSVSDDARLQLAENLRKVAHDLRALAPDKQLGITEFGFLFGGATQLNAIMTADMVRVAVEEQLELALRHILIEDDPHEPFADEALLLGPDHTPSPAYQLLTVLAPALTGLTAVPVTPSASDLPLLAARDAGGDHLVLLLLDRRSLALQPSALSVRLPDGDYRGTLTVLGAPDLESTGSDVVRSDTTVTASGSLPLTLPPNGVAVAVLTRQ